MKKLLMILALIFSFRLIADMRYNLITAQLYSYPQTPEINQEEYLFLFVNCAEIERRMMVMNGYILPAGKSILNQLVYYLNTVGTPTALRLADDSKKNTVCYQDGSFYKKIWLDF